MSFCVSKTSQSLCNDGNFYLGYIVIITNAIIMLACAQESR